MAFFYVFNIRNMLECSTEMVSMVHEKIQKHIAEFFQKSCIISLEDNTQKIMGSSNIDIVCSQVYAAKDAEGDQDR